MAQVTLSGVHKTYAGGVVAVQDVNLEIRDEEFVVLVGPSGCGKSTTLRMIAGLEDITGGTIAIGERVVNHLPPKDRDIAMVFQNYALYQHMSVYDNLAFGLRNRKVPEDRIRAEIDRAVEILGMRELLARRPRQLSGGQQQRVAVARALVGQPSILLADEPTGNLDSKTSAEIMALFDELHDQGQTLVVVTHEPDIAAHCERTIRVNDGRIVEDSKHPEPVA